jgi:membrane protein DedA with SNARE-associated domain
MQAFRPTSGCPAMMHFADHLLREYGYGVITLAIAIECAGLLFPGETIFFGSAVYASTTHHLSIFLIIGAAIVGATIGNFIGFAIGRLIGARLLGRHGCRIGLTQRRLALGRYLFRRHGGKVVFFSRFVSVLRSFNPLLAGASEMPIRAFVCWTIVGGIAWPCIHGGFAYALGNTARRLSGPFQIALGLAVVLGVVFILRFIKQNETRLEELALRSEFYEKNHA